MTRRPEALEVYAEATAPGEDQISRVRQRLLGEVSGPATSAVLLRHLPGGDDQAVDRIRQRLLPSTPGRKPGRAGLSCRRDGGLLVWRRS